MTTNLEQLKESLADRYRILEELGEGGMATVYLAEDLRHDRKVAVKVLRPELAAVIGADRFLAEIKTTANLQHPNILPLFDSGEVDGLLFYVMPYVEGESLRDVMVRNKQLPIDHALRIASEVAGALDYAHRQSVIHRDIKPENILIHDGRALVADFGIALAVTSAGDTRMTETGMSLGTPHYMSPEQAMGERELDARSDVYALGCVLYEMLTGEPPFTGTTAQAIVARVVTESPRPLVPQRHTIPHHVEAAVLKAIEKLPADRFPTAAAFAEALTNPAAAYSRPPLPSPTGGFKINPVTMTLAALVVGLAGLLVWRWDGPDPGMTGTVRMGIDLPSGVQLAPAYGPSMALAPDGSGMIQSGFREGTSSRLMQRRWDRLAVTELRGIEAGGYGPVYSPDGRSIVYGTAIGHLMTYSLASGTKAMVIDSGLTDVALRGGGIDWGSDGMIYAAGLNGLVRVSPLGGALEQVTVIDTARGELTHAWVDVLPNGRGALITVIPRNIADFASHVVSAVDLESGEIKQLFQGVFARYAPSGYVVFVLADGALMAAPFDQDALELTGEAVLLPDSVLVGPTGAVDLAVSAAGVMAYMPKSDFISDLVWVNRAGVETGPLAGWSTQLVNPSLSPDGDQIAASAFGPEGWQVWVGPVEGGPETRLSFAGSNNTRAVWAPDGRSVSYISNQLGPTEPFMAPTDGTGGELPLPTGDPRPMFGLAWHPDGSWLVLRTDNQVSGVGDILAVRPGIDSVARVLAASPAEEISPAVSPDGRWLAYVSAVTGGREIYIQPFLGSQDEAVRVSRNGGTEPQWSRSGRELFYRSAQNSLVAVEIIPGDNLRVGRRQPLFSMAGYRPHEFHRNYDVAPDGQRFLVVKTADRETEMVVVFNWDRELRSIFADQR